MKRGFILGRFMPPHGGHVSLCEAAAALVDELTILVCWQGEDPIPGPVRLSWMKELFPQARVLGHGEPAPQAPEDHPDFWTLWRGIVRQHHPEPIDFVFAGEPYGQKLAETVGGLFVPLGARILGADKDGVGGVTTTAIREDFLGHWQWLPGPVRRDVGLRVSLQGVESTGKSVLAEKLARHFGTIWVPEYGRSHCEVHGTELTSDELLLIGNAQRAMVDAGVPWSSGVTFIDTDHLMTAAWHEMMLGQRHVELETPRHADLYLLLDPDVPWVDDGLRIYGEVERRQRFAGITEDVLVRNKVPFVRLSGDWDAREATAVKAVEALMASARLWRLQARWTPHVTSP